jgi:hypothetical protein
VENQLCLIIGIQFVVFSHPRLGLSRTGHALPWKNLQGPRRDRWVSQDGAPSGKSSAGKPHISWEKFHGFRFSLKPIHKWLKSTVSDTLWLFNMALDNGP